MHKIITNEELFVENSPHTIHTVKNRIKQLSLIEYKCSKCHCSSWNGKNLSLQIDHINGNKRDNRLSNLRYLCPNCHSQTPTYGGKNTEKYKQSIFINGKKKYKKQCSHCNCEVLLNYGQSLCELCYKKQVIDHHELQKKFDPTKEELTLKIYELKGNLCALGRFYNVSDNAIKKRINKFNLLHIHKATKEKYRYRRK